MVLLFRPELAIGLGGAVFGWAGCLQGALLAELMRVIRGALFSWKTGHLKA